MAIEVRTQERLRPPPYPLPRTLTEDDGGDGFGSDGVTLRAVEAVVASGGVGRVDDGVAEAVALGDVVAAGGAGVVASGLVTVG